MTILKYWHENINMEIISNIELYIDKRLLMSKDFWHSLQIFSQQEFLFNFENNTLEWHTIRDLGCDRLALTKYSI